MANNLDLPIVVVDGRNMYCPVVGSRACISCRPTCGGRLGGGNIESSGIVADAAR